MTKSQFCQTVLVLMVVALAGPIRLFAAGFDRIEINVPDPPSAAAWYAKTLEGHATTLESASAVAFGNVTLRFGRVRGPIADSVGSGIDHLGFSYANIDAAMQRFARLGVRIVSGIEKDGPVRYAFIHDPWSTLIEVVEDPQIRGFHHIHVASHNPKATLKWYADVFGGKVSRFAGLIPGIRYGQMWVLVKGTKRLPAPTKGAASITSAGPSPTSRPPSVDCTPNRPFLSPNRMTKARSVPFSFSGRMPCDSNWFDAVHNEGARPKDAAPRRGHRHSRGRFELDGRDRAVFLELLAEGQVDLGRHFHVRHAAWSGASCSRSRRG